MVRFILVLLGVGIGSGGPLGAQGSLGRGPVYGPSFDRLGSLTEGPVAFGYRHSRLTGAGPAEDLALRLFPEALPAGVAVLGIDAGAMQALAVGPVAVFMKGGASVIANLGLHETSFIPGLQAGGGILVRLERRAALRFDVTRHFFNDAGERYRVWSFGLGLAVLPHATETRQR